MRSSTDRRLTATLGRGAETRRTYRYAVRRRISIAPSLPPLPTPPRGGVYVRAVEDVGFLPRIYIFRRSQNAHTATRLDGGQELAARRREPRVENGEALRKRFEFGFRYSMYVRAKHDGEQGRRD